MACALGLWVVGWLSWCHAVFRRREGGFEDGGPQFEHKCLAFVGLSVALYLVGNLRGAPGSASWGLASEMLRSLAAAVFLVAALCMADGISRRGVDNRFTIAIARFYAPKVALGVAALMFMLLVDLALFPSLAGWDHGSLVAMDNWPHAQQVAFTLVAVAEMALMAMWAVWMVWMITSAGRLLRQLPYVPTRFQQLSYTFFGLQMLFLVLVFAVLALARLARILDTNLGGNSVGAEFLLFVVNTRQDHTASVWIALAFALQLLLLFLPPSLKECALLRGFVVRFVHFESQVPRLGRSSKSDANGREEEKKQGTGRGRGGGGGGAAAGGGRGGEQQGVGGEPGHRDPEDGSCTSVARGGVAIPGDARRISPPGVRVAGGNEGGGGSSRSCSRSSDPVGTAGGEGKRPLLCLETAAWLLEVSEETYKMPPDPCKPNNEANVAVADFERVGLEVFGYISNAEHDTHCFVLKDDRRARVVVAFRGAVCRRSWMNRLRFKQTEFNLDAMMPVGREAEAPKVLAEEVMDPWPAAESAPLAAQNGGNYAAPGTPAAGDGGREKSESAVPRGQCLPRASAHRADAGAFENNTVAVPTSPSLSTLNGGGDAENDDGDDNVLGSTTLTPAAAAAGSHPALGRFFFPKSESNISRSMDDAAWAGNATKRGGGGTALVASTDESPAVVAPSATVVKRLTRSRSRSAGAASREAPGGGGGIDPKSWSSTGGGGGGGGDGRELDKKGATTTPPSAPPPYVRPANASTPSAAADGGGDGNGDYDEGGGSGGGGGGGGDRRRKDGERRGSTGRRWIRRLLRTASSIGASSFGGGDSPMWSSDFESEDAGGKEE
ncbi:unnamed protein product, partial [Ectocarpus sp. 8 AP-2014]